MSDKRFLWREKPVFSSDDMVKFANAMAIRILSSQGQDEVTLDHLGKWVRKNKIKNKGL